MHFSRLTPIAIALALIGCQSTPINSNKYISEKHLQKEQIENENGGYPAYKAVIDAAEAVTTQQLKAYVAEGVLLTRANCLNTLSDIREGNKRNSYTKEQFLIGTVLATGMMAINGASSDSFKELALGSSFLVSSFDLYRNYYLLGPNSSSVMELIEEALIEQQKFSLGITPTNFTEASTLILNFSRVCSSSHIDTLVENSIKNAKLEVPKKESAIIPVLSNVGEVLDIETLTIEQLAAISYAIENGIDKADNIDSIKSIKDDISKNFKQLQFIIFNLPRDIKAPLEQLYSNYNPPLDFVDSHVNDKELTNLRAKIKADTAIDTDISLRTISALYYLARELNPNELLANNKEIRDSIGLLPDATIDQIENDRNEFEKIKAVFRQLDQQTLTKLEKNDVYFESRDKRFGFVGDSKSDAAQSAVFPTYTTGSGLVQIKED